MFQCEDKFNRKTAHFRFLSMALKRRVLRLSTLSDNWIGLPSSLESTQTRMTARQYDILVLFMAQCTLAKCNAIW